MKVTVIYNKKPALIEKDRDYIQLTQLSQLENGLYDDIDIGDCMDYIPFSERVKLLSTAASKMKYGGKLHISAYDLTAVANSVFNGYIKVFEANGVLFKHKLSCSTVELVLKNLEALDLEVENCHMTALTYNITAKRKL